MGCKPPAMSKDSKLCTPCRRGTHWELQKIPWARRVEVGSGRGQVPHYDFGHQWYGYFDVETWRGVIEVFLESPAGSTPEKEGRAKL